VRILEGGLLTTVQDLGRYGYQKVGVTPSGAMDALSHRVANILVDNPEDAATLEITLKGPAIEFTSDALIALCGAQLPAQVSGVELPRARAIALRQGSVLTFGAATAGCRAYLSVAGGISVPAIMGSRSTYLRAAIGGHEGRALRAGDQLVIGEASVLATNATRQALSDDDPLPFALSGRFVDDDDPRLAFTPRPIRCVPGPHFDAFDEGDKRTFFASPYRVSTEADRMGYRLSGPLLSSAQGRELVSSAVTTGAVQVPPGGEPIVLMADRQTTGGYPVVAQVITADLPVLAQMKPGAELSFSKVSVADAQDALRQMHRALADIRKELEPRVSDRPQR
jgi:antagonist of KipI